MDVNITQYVIAMDNQEAKQDSAQAIKAACATIIKSRRGRIVYANRHDE